MCFFFPCFCNCICLCFCILILHPFTGVRSVRWSSMGQLPLHSSYVSITLLISDLFPTVEKKVFFNVHQYLINISISATTTECFDCTTSSKYPFKRVRITETLLEFKFHSFKTNKTNKQTQLQKLLIFRDLTWVCLLFRKFFRFGTLTRPLCSCFSPACAFHLLKFARWVCAHECALFCLFLYLPFPCVCFSLS